MLVLPLHGRFNQLGAYLLELGVGTPPQPLSAIIDTGSSSTFFPCDSCARSGACGRHGGHAGYDSGASATAAACVAPPAGSSLSAGCTYARHYAEGSSLTGRWVTDRVALAGGAFTPAAAFGCNSRETGLFRQDAAADGVLGLGGGGSRSLLAALVAAGALPSAVFSLCLADAGGALALGGAHAAVHTAAGASTRLSVDERSGWFSVHIAAVSVGWQRRAPPRALRAAIPAPPWSAAADGGYGADGLPAVLDSGSSFSHLPAAALAALLRGFRAACRLGDRRARLPPCGGITEVPPRALPAGQVACFELPANQPVDEAQLPALTLRFADGAAVHIGARAYLVRMAWLGPLHCLGVYDSAHARGRTIIGADLMRHADITFDAARASLGWAPARCPEEADEEEAAGDAGGGGDAIQHHPHSDSAAFVARPPVGREEDAAED